MKLLESDFSFSKRMRNFFLFMEFTTVADLVAIPLEKFTCFKGFKLKCKQELIAFIKFEGLENHFEGFSKWKSSP